MKIWKMECNVLYMIGLHFSNRRREYDLNLRGRRSSQRQDPGEPQSVHCFRVFESRVCPGRDGFTPRGVNKERFRG